MAGGTVQVKLMVATNPLAAEIDLVIVLLVEQVFGAFQEVQAVSDDGATEIESRSSVPDAVQVPASDGQSHLLLQPVLPL